MAQQQLAYSTTDLNTLPSTKFTKPYFHASAPTSHVEMDYFAHPHHNIQHELCKPKSALKHRTKPCLSGYPSADSSCSNSSSTSTKYKEKKTTYKFQSGEQFVSYGYLVPHKIIGEGSYATVCSALDTRTHKKYAIKKNRNCFVNIGDAKRILREMKLMYHFQGHPNLMSVIDVIPPDIGTQQKFSDVYLIMPKMHMTLAKLITKSSIGKVKLCGSDIETIMYQMCRGLEYMHSAGVIHRDLKPENILLNCYYHECDDPQCTVVNKNLWQVRVTDFGLARGIHNIETYGFELDAENKKGLTEYVVTRYYRAPEVMCCSRLYDSQIDVWSLGCIMGELYLKKPLFRGNNHLHQLQVIFYFCGTPHDLSWIKMNDAKQWISQLPKHKKRDFQKEFSFDKCSTMTDAAADLLNQLLVVNPAKRCDITTALKHPFFKRICKQTDEYECAAFDSTFETEPILRTNFGVRHMMYEELLRIHKHCKNNFIL
eukprot:310330_1